MTPVYHLPKWKFLLYLFTVPGMFSRYRKVHPSLRSTFYRACSWLDFLRHYKPNLKWRVEWIGDSETLPFYIGHDYGDSPYTLFTRVIPIRHFDDWGGTLWQDRHSLVVFKYQDETIYKI